MGTSTTSAFPSPERVGDSRWLERAVRLGYAARALLYGVIAVTALQVALGQGGRTQGSKGAISSMADQPFGTVLLLAVAVGLGGYALWRAVQALKADGDSLAERVGARLFYGIRAVLYGSTAWIAFRTALGGGSGGSGSESRLTAQVLDLPFGVPLVLAVGLGIVGYAVYQGYRAATQSFEDELETGRMSATEQRWVTRIAIVGYAARAIVFGMIGVFVAVAALQYDPEEAKGLDGALAELASTPYGTWLLGAVALGLLSFGLYSAAEARYRRISTD